jgi:hypothetical protein
MMGHLSYCCIGATHAIRYNTVYVQKLAVIVQWGYVPLVTFCSSFV